MQSDLKPTRRVPAYVSITRGAWELDLSVTGFRAWVRNGILPGPAPGSPPSTPRWKWATIERWMAGDRSEIPASQADLFGQCSRAGYRKRGPKPGHGGRPRMRRADPTAPAGAAPDEAQGG